ncbi:MAG: hypothetical protein AAGE52_30470 [Myxococcota bacterium]
MNFFGHCCVAAWTHTNRAFVLGTMLPDFATMSGGRIQGSSSTDVSEGIAHHHATDSVFHSATTFVHLCATSSKRMDSEEVRWGTARAVAHIGVELFLDGWLLERQPENVRASYLEALERAKPEDLGSGLHWRKDETSDRFEALRKRLLNYGLPAEIGDPEVVLSRLKGALRGRSRLAILHEDEAAIARELDRLVEEVRSHAATLMEEVRTGLTPSV